MNHLIKFEELDYLSQLRSQKQQRQDFDEAIRERQELTHIVLQSLIYSEQNRDGFENFKNDLKNFLENYPLENLPKSGHLIYKT